jgi:hypothetical protein
MDISIGDREIGCKEGKTFQLVIGKQAVRIGKW